MHPRLHPPLGHRAEHELSNKPPTVSTSPGTLVQGLWPMHLGYPLQASPSLKRLRGRGSHCRTPQSIRLPSSGPCRIRYCVVSAPPSSALVTAMQPGRKRRAEW